MVIKTASPGVIVNEVDLTRGTSDGITSNVACLAGPFTKGPVDKITLVQTEVEFQDIFGNPTDENYEYWFSVDNFLEYGGTCYVVRSDDEPGGNQAMRNAADGPKTDSSGNEIKYYVKNADDFEENIFNVDAAMGGLPAKFIAQNPGTWGNNISVAVIDHGADYQLSLKSDKAYNAATGVAVQGPIYFDKTVSLGDDVGVYVKVAAAAETITQVPQFANVRTAHAGNKDIAGGGVYGAVTLTNSGSDYGLRSGTSTRDGSNGSGSGLSITTTISNGVITSVDGIADGGIGYVVGDVIQIDGSLTLEATVEVKTVDIPGAPIASLALTDAGTL